MSEYRRDLWKGLAGLGVLAMAAALSGCGGTGDADLSDKLARAEAAAEKAVKAQKAAEKAAVLARAGMSGVPVIEDDAPVFDDDDGGEDYAPSPPSAEPEMVMNGPAPPLPH